MSGDADIDALLGALRRAAEDDGVEDVDAVVAQFATFVRARAPHLASHHARHRTGRSSWGGATIAAGLLVAAAVGAVASGVVTDPFGGGRSTPAVADGAVDADAASGESVIVLPAGGASASAGPATGGATGDGDIAADDPSDTAPVGEVTEMQTGHVGELDEQLEQQPVLEAAGPLPAVPVDTVDDPQSSVGATSTTAAPTPTSSSTTTSSQRLVASTRASRSASVRMDSGISSK